MYQQHIFLKISYTYQVSWQLSWLLLNISNCQSVFSTTNYLYMHGSYISKFDFINYLLGEGIIRACAKE